MKRLLLAAIASLAGLSAGQAADIVQPATFDWTGPYVGLNAGYAFSTNAVDLESVGSDPFPQTDVLDVIGTNRFDLDSDGFIGGGQLGYNWQMDSLVLGLEADAQFADVEGSEKKTNGDEGFKGSQKLDFLATLRARLGYAVSDGIMIFGTGGLAVGSLDLNSHLTNDDFAGGDEWDNDSSTTKWGWTIGGGAEFMVSDNISIKAEYLYVDLGDETFRTHGNEDPENEIVKSDFDNRFHIIRAGLNWHF